MTTLSAADHRQKTGRSGAVPAPSPTTDHIPAVSAETLLAALSLALDLAEGRQKGHAARVARICATLATAMGMTAAQQTTARSAGLLHDIGVPHATGSLGDCGRGSEHDLFAGLPLQSPETLAARFDRRRMVEIMDAVSEHAFEGATASAALGLPPPVAEAILCHHERHDGGGYPLGLSGNEVPPIARIVAVADYAESLLAATPNPLVARRSLEAGLREHSGRAFHPEVVDALITICRGDEFWIAFHGGSRDDAPAETIEPEGRPLSEVGTLRLAGAFAGIVEARNVYKRGHSQRVALHARRLALALDLSESHARAVELAALLQDIGMLRVPTRIIGKPEILSVEEMRLLHQHPLESAEIIGAVPGWERIAGWTAAHHERLDGRGYPEGLTEGDIPLESRILAAADVYAALTADRPHREALSAEEALGIMGGMVGVNLDRAVFVAFASSSPGTAERPKDAAGV